jgi:vacuolar-type H+-ATPase subunit D/Vma8
MGVRALAQMKVRLKGAQQGYNLLKKKADALTSRFRAILRKIVEVRLQEHVQLYVGLMHSRLVMCCVRPCS